MTTRRFCVEYRLSGYYYSWQTDACSVACARERFLRHTYPGQEQPHVLSVSEVTK